MQSERVCPRCGSTDADYRCSDRHREYVTCVDCGRDYEVDAYA